jgi:hypothetical protein
VEDAPDSGLEVILPALIERSTFSVISAIVDSLAEPRASDIDMP